MSGALTLFLLHIFMACKEATMHFIHHCIPFRWIVLGPSNLTNKQTCCWILDYHLFVILSYMIWAKNSSPEASHFCKTNYLFRVPWWYRLQIPPKCQYISTKLQDITPQRTVNLIFTVSKNPGAPTYLFHACFIQILEEVFTVVGSLFSLKTGYSLIINVGYRVPKCTSMNKITVLSICLNRPLSLGPTNETDWYTTVQGTCEYNVPFKCLLHNYKSWFPFEIQRSQSLHFTQIKLL